MGMTKAMEFRMVEKKFFQDRIPREPKLLTWAAKEKIRYLHHEDPTTWTPEKLAESFPCSINGIKVGETIDYRCEELKTVLFQCLRVA
jgi:hypothetical protein